MMDLNRRAFLGFSASALVLTACGSTSGATPPAGAQQATAPKLPLPQLIDAAKKEGTITIYHSTSLEEEQAWCKNFTDKYGINIVFYRATTGQIFERWTNEAQAGKDTVDVVATNDPFLMSTVTDLGMTANYVVEDDANFEPAMMRSGYCYPLQLLYEGIAWNTNNTTPAEIEMIRSKGWDALRDPIWNGRYTTSSPAGGGTNQVWWWYPVRAAADKYGPEYLQQLAAHKPAIFESKIPLFDRMAAGEYSICDIATETVAGAQVLAGAPIQWMYPDPTPVAVTQQAVATKAVHPNAARLFQEWATSPEGQEAWATVNQATPANKKARDLRKIRTEPWWSPPTNIYAGWQTDPNFNDEANRQKMYDEWQSIFGTSVI